MSTATAIKKPKLVPAPVVPAELTDVKLVREKDIFSEISHYIFQRTNSDGNMVFRHLSSGQLVHLTPTYVARFLASADQFGPGQIEEVGKEDKFWTKGQVEKLDPKVPDNPREGDLKQKGIRTIWAEIHSAQVFTVEFYTSATILSEKSVREAREAQLKEALDSLVLSSKTTKLALEAAFKKVQDNPISDIQRGNLRKLRGYKKQFSSITGQYDVIDMDIPDGQNNTRQVNVNNITWLVYNGIKYIVKQ